MQTTTDTANTADELDRAFDLVSELSERIEDVAICVDEMDLRMSLLFAEAEGEVVTSAPPAWALAA